MKKILFKKDRSLNTNNELKRQGLINAKLLEVSKMDVVSLVRKMNVSLNGLNNEKVEEMREVYGNNVISTEKSENIIVKFIKAFINPFTIILILLSIISFFTDIVMAAPGDKDPTSVIIMVTMVTVSGLLKFVQELRSGSAAEKLKELIETTTSVTRREEGTIEIPLSEVVSGDIVNLAAGDMVPADLRIIKAKDLFISESGLTGESNPVEKVVNLDKDKVYKSALDCENIAFMGSNVISGAAKGIVVSTGNDTIFGSMSKAITGKGNKSSFEKGVNSVSWLLISFMAVMVPVVFFINGITKGDWIQALLFSISIAVGLTPEMLPMIVTTSLAKGAVTMSKKKTVIKNLNSIQNFGAMDVLCTDKTGTLTQDKVVLEYHLDIEGNEDDRVLRHAFMNSHFQTGLKNLIDVAIIEEAYEKGLKDLYKDYKKIDEIPFDFNRRRMSVIIKDNEGKTQLITKGAIEEMLNVCKYVEYKGEIKELDKKLIKKILETVDKLNDDGMRVIGLAQKTNPSAEGEFKVSDESDMVLMGYLAFLDPPKESTERAIKSLKEYGVKVKVLTGDNDRVTKCICKKVGIEIDNIVLGSDIETMDDIKLAKVAEETSVFAKLSPSQKTRIVRILRENGHVVGFMGDGINDAAAMKESDVGISVDTAVDIAKESADIILLEKDLEVLEEGVIEGRKTFANMIKYIKMTASSNFGNMFSVLVASAFLPFLPMISIQLIILNLIYDLSCIAIPWDNVDKEYLKNPKMWDASSIGKFMKWIGPTSSVFDILTFIVMYFIVCPIIAGGNYNDPGVNQILFVAAFNAGWFIESLITQTLVVHMIRTEKTPFVRSIASKQVLIATAVAVSVGAIIPFTEFGEMLGMVSLPLIYFLFVALIVIGYMILVTVAKKSYIKKYGELL
ncbi:MAG: magnesium-translocating P-type ATPase [Clostridium sp.]|uniref:magnesium-translocating P-type ATPase n=1 Tax=Clostridium TaxID=1485 RepID=UPI0021522872|nr:magnesium-translocating P-type ATPase [Clostridium sp. LY3-2]MCR6516163.1 magnesium-translocating P-type ATPase [Clostridium sp. LY3-2]